MLDIVNATYSREVFQCDIDNSENMGVAARMAYAQRLVYASRGIAGCSEVGFRYIIPSLGLRGRF